MHFFLFYDKLIIQMYDKIRKEERLMQKLINFVKKLNSKVMVATLSLLCFLNSTVLVSAGKDESTSSLSGAEELDAKTVSGYFDKITVYGQVLMCGVALVCALIFCAYPGVTGGEEGQQKAKKNGKNILLWFIVAELIFNVAKTLLGFFDIQV